MQFIKSLLLLCRGGDWGVGALQNFFEPPDILFNLKLWFAWIGRFKIAVEVSKCFFSADILTIWYWYRYMQLVLGICSVVETWGRLFISCAWFRRFCFNISILHFGQRQTCEKGRGRCGGESWGRQPAGRPSKKWS